MPSPPETVPKDEESETERFERLARGLFEAPREAVLEAEKRFKGREKRRPSS